ncbi:M16 family metallopeptidase [Aestuariibaculum suncheonense]|uniref:Insulinase family protein n=1 Tax=Aestuariibaculum suncheonense TaxID=1028745 RepID=A0A8J6QHX3_9FLAO|nr:M16 family metallopeptidase [Aestuariibaculum suncheonense]MBD0836022.1 insulinase family protein [Aestuariibaculum suncheonense]
MKAVLSYVLIVASVFCVGAQDLSQPIPVDQSIKKGVLPNGMTYYIKSTDVVKDAASYYIIQNVGSVLENEDQRGLAHFLEHMAFNGTEHFPGKGILNTLQKHGAVFGKDINAYTSFDETVYNLSDIPTKDGLVDTCLTVLQDWSNYLALTEDEIDAERGVIKEEWRTRQNGQMRLYEVSMPITYNHSKYADRMPIGLMSVVEGFKYKALRDFYHDWYRTDLQAIAVIGDVNVDEIEQKIIDKFSKIPAVDHPKERYVVNIPDNEDMLFSFGTDPEVSSASISFGIRHKKSLADETVGDLKKALLESMAISSISARIREKSQQPDAAFLSASVGYGGLSRTSKALSVGIYPKPNQQQDAFTEVLTEVIRAVKFGYTQSEIDRAITIFDNSYQNQIAKQDDRSHKSIENIIQSNYLSNSTMADVEKEYEIAKQLFSKITPEDVHNTIKRLYTKNNRFLNVIGVEGQDNLTEAQAREIIANVENSNTIEPYTEALDGKTLVSGLNIVPGTITSISKEDKVGSTTYVLSNGVKVHYKFVDKQKDRVALNAISYGGKSLLNDEDLASAGFVTSLLGMSGLGDFKATDLRKVLAGKTANVSVSLGDISENVSGNSNTKDVETMLQLVHVYFVKPRFDEDAYKVLQNNLDNYLLRRGKDIGEKMKDSLTYAIYGKNNPKKPIFDQEFINQVSFDKIKAVYADRFSDASDFEFFIVGDVKEEQLKPLLEKYIASLPTHHLNESYKDNSVEWVANTIDKDIYIAMEDPKASVNVVYKREMPYVKKNVVYTSVLGDMLQLRVTETVRESEGGAYSPRAGASFSREPKPAAYVNFSFDCNPDMADRLVEIVKNELQKIANGTINEEDLNKTRTNYLKENEQSKDNNGYDMAMLTRYFRYNENINDPKNFVDIVKNMKAKDIQKIAKEILKGGHSYEIIFKPEQ